jgi:hypothetical protein
MPIGLGGNIYNPRQRRTRGLGALEYGDVPMLGRPSASRTRQDWAQQLAGIEPSIPTFPGLEQAAATPSLDPAPTPAPAPAAAPAPVAQLAPGTYTTKKRRAFGPLSEITAGG